MLKAHTGDGKQDEDPSHQQTLNLIMQLITNNVQQQVSDEPLEKGGIDPLLLQ
jgi:hypothetical protein